MLKVGKSDQGGWTKHGVLLTPTSQHFWLNTHAGPSFVDTSTTPARLYVTGRDAQNHSHIGVFELRQSGIKLEVVLESGRVVFSPGELGTFDESGVSYPWLVHDAGRILMYYVGWTAGGLTRFQNFTGLAISTNDGTTFSRVGPIPILDRTDSEPYGSGSCAVWREGALWNMIYTAFEAWTLADGTARPTYRLKEATSTDGIHWHRSGRVIVDFASPEEHIIGKPMVLKDGTLTRLWYSHRGASYRIGYAESVDGRIFRRMDDCVGIDVSTRGWDAEMIEYAYVFDLGGVRYMVYNGNGFGETGLGYAILE